jgi:predicted dehydrogenase
MLPLLVHNLEIGSRIGKIGPYLKNRFCCNLRVEKLTKNVDLAVIGAGYWGRKVAEEYLRLARVDSGFNLAHVCDLKEANLENLADSLHLGSEKLSTDYEAILKMPDVNAVHICTPNGTHFPIGLQALCQGKNVLMEKPLALSKADSWKLCDAASARRLCLQVGHIYRFSNALKKVKELVKDGFFGKLYYLKLQWTTWMPSPLGRDIIFDLGPHPIDILNFLLEKWPVKVGCVGRSYRRPDLEEMAYLNLDFGENLMSVIELSWLHPGKTRELTIMGSERAAIVDCLGQRIRVFEDNLGHNYEIDVPENNTIYDEVSHFVTSIRDESNHKNPGQVGANLVSVLESLQKSSREERPVTVG